MSTHCSCIANVVCFMLYSLILCFIVCQKLEPKLFISLLHRIVKPFKWFCLDESLVYSFATIVKSHSHTQLINNNVYKFHMPVWWHSMNKGLFAQLYQNELLSWKQKKKTFERKNNKICMNGMSSTDIVNPSIIFSNNAVAYPGNGYLLMNDQHWTNSFQSPFINFSQRLFIFDLWYISYISYIPWINVRRK